jgi:hypothetical protein
LGERQLSGSLNKKTDQEIVITNECAADNVTTTLGDDDVAMLNSPAAAEEDTTTEAAAAAAAAGEVHTMMTETKTDVTKEQVTVWNKCINVLFCIYKEVNSA